MIGIIDIGSNTMHLKVYRKVGKKIKPVFDRKEFAKLANYIDENKQMSEDGINKCIEILDEYMEVLKVLNIKDAYVIATAPLRNITNTEYAVKRIKDSTGIDVDVLTGEDEAFYGYIGARYQYEDCDALVVDIGGGSTELAFESGDGLQKVSIPYGSLNTYSMFVNRRIPNADEYSLIKDTIKGELELTPNHSFEKIIGIGGTVRSINKVLAAMKKDCDEITLDIINELLKFSMRKPKEWLRILLNSIPERVFTFTTGLIILKTIMKYYKVQNIEVCNFGIRDGYILTKNK